MSKETHLLRIINGEPIDRREFALVIAKSYIEDSKLSTQMDLGIVIDRT